MTFRNVLSFRGIENARTTKRYHFGIIHGAGRSLAMNVFNPHGGVEKAYLKQEFSSITNRFYYMYKFIKRYLSPQHYVKVWVQRREYADDEGKKLKQYREWSRKTLFDTMGFPRRK